MTGDPIPLRVFLADDHEIVRRGLCELLEAHPDLEVVGEAGSVEEALARVPPTRPDVAVLDVRLGDGSGISLCRDLQARDPHLRCLMLTSHPDDDAFDAAVIAGASGYVLKQIAGRELVESIRRVGSGESLIAESERARALERMARPPGEDDRLTRLNGRERQVLELVAEGMTNRQIGATMYLAEKTVKNYVTSVLAKLGVHHRTEAAVYAARLGERRAHSR